MAGKSDLDPKVLKSIRKQIRQDDFDKKVFLSILNNYTESIYKHRQQKIIDDTIRLILNRGHLEDGSNDLAAAVIFSGLKKTNETDFPIFVRAFQILFKFAGSLAIGGGKDEVMYFANKLQKILGFKLIVVGELPKISTRIGVNTNGREIIISQASQ